MTKQKHPGGRPTKYRPEMLDRIIELSKTGATIAMICADLDIVVQTYHNWKEKYPEFLEASKKGDTYRRAWWDRLGCSAASGKVKDCSMGHYALLMANMFGVTQKTAIEIDGKLDVDYKHKLEGVSDETLNEAMELLRKGRK
jgi:transposase-like protein